MFLDEEEFDRFVARYEAAAKAAIRTEEDYRMAHNEALATSDGKNAEARKADADRITHTLRLDRDLSALERETARFRVIYRLPPQGGQP